MGLRFFGSWQASNTLDWSDKYPNIGKILNPIGGPLREQTVISARMAQQKKTDQFEVGELPELTPQQSEFVRHVLAGKSKSDAYRLAYNTENMQVNTIWARASELSHNSKVEVWLTAARTANMGAGMVTLESHLSELERLREIALKTGNVGAAVNAEVSRGKAAGLHVDKIQDITRENDVVGTLREIAQYSPELAADMAAKHDIPWQADEGATKH